MLENILAEMEDFTWIANTVHAIYPSGDPLYGFFPEHNTFRDAILHNDSETAKKVTKQITEVAARDSGFNFQLDVALDISNWYFASQRVFTVSESLQEMLLGTNLPEFHLDQMNFVAESFAISLEQPIRLSDGGNYNLIIVRASERHHEGVPMLSVRAYEQSYEVYQPITDAKKRIVIRDAKKGSPRVKKFVDKQVKNSKKKRVTGFVVEIGSHNVLEVLKTIAVEHELEDWTKLYQLVLGLNLYLQTARLPEDTEHITRFHHPKVIPKDAREPFTNGTEIFSLGTSQAFSRHHPSEDDEHESVGSVRPHFRRGFWRRPKGLGNDPTATATIWVRPTWVHQDRINAGEKPVGSNQTVQNVSSTAPS